VPTKGSNPMQDKGKGKVSYSPGGEQTCKMKSDPTIMKVALEA